MQVLSSVDSQESVDRMPSFDRFRWPSCGEGIGYCFKLRKAGGTSRIVPEELMFGGLLLHRVLLGLLIGERVVSLMAGEMC